ncbi:MAG TPA: hypothetical protein VGV90_10120 [Solirubrobacteraceae bacterium]|nr:hypothetical protein [Solirubrobacteraceae bacterium]
MTRVLTCIATLVALLSGCGGGESEPPSEPLGTGGLARAFDLARSEGRVDMRLKATTTRPGRGTRPQFEAEGEIDLAASAGEATLGVAGFAGAEIPDMSVSWTAAEVKANGKTLARKAARVSGGQLGMLPDEAQAMAELVADAEGVRERANGSWTFTVPAAAAIRRGIPPQPQSGENWSGEAQADADGRLRRVVVRLATPALGTTIPAGTAALELKLG